MSVSKKVKIVVFVPESHSNAVRVAMADAGAGQIGNYSGCSFWSKGTGCFTPEEGAQPSIGMVGKVEFVPEYRIEATCDRAVLDAVVNAIKAVHPYEEVAMDVYPLEEY